MTARRGPKSGPKSATIEKVSRYLQQVREGKTFVQIAAEDGVSRQAVTKLLRTRVPAEELSEALGEQFNAISSQRQRPCEICQTPTTNPRFCSSICAGKSYHRHDDLYLAASAMLEEGATFEEAWEALKPASLTFNTFRVMIYRYRQNATQEE